MNCLVSIIMPVYNGALYIRESIESILSQTYSNFEFIIINDGSSDNTLEIIHSYADSRIILIDQKNTGTSQAMNVGIRIAKGQYVARMDHDDIAMPERIAMQVQFLMKNPNYGVVGSSAYKIDACGNITGSIICPTTDEEIKVKLLRNTPFVHSSVMFSVKVFSDVGLYSNDFSRQPPEDFELFSRIQKKYKLANLSNILLLYRELSTGLSNVLKPHIRERVILISQENIQSATKFHKGSKISAAILANHPQSINILKFIICACIYLISVKKITKSYWKSLYYTKGVCVELCTWFIKNLTKRILRYQR